MLSLVSIGYAFLYKELSVLWFILAEGELACFHFSDQRGSHFPNFPDII